MSGPDGHSLSAPSIAGDDLYGLVAVWNDSENDDQLAFSTRLPGTDAWQAPIYPGARRSAFSPAVTLAYDWFDVAIAWTDTQHQVQLMLTSQPKQPIALTGPGGASGSPALAYGDDAIWCAYRSEGSGDLMLAGYFKNGTMQTYSLGIQVSGDPTLTFNEGSLLFGLGGSTKEAAAMAIYACTVSDPVNTFVLFPGGPTFSCCGAPALSIEDGLYCLAYADEELTLRTIVTGDLTQCIPEDRLLKCAAGSVSTAIVLGSLNVGSTVTDGAEVTGANRLCITSFLLGGASSKARNARSLSQAEAQAPCANGLILDPSTGKCVITTSCVGRCVTSSMGIRGVFNPIAFAYCLWKNC